MASANGANGANSANIAMEADIQGGGPTTPDRPIVASTPPRPVRVRQMAYRITDIPMQPPLAALDPLSPMSVMAPGASAARRL